MSMLRRVAIAIATAGGVGYAPVAPGTFGSAVGLAVYAALRLVRVPGAEIAAIVLVFAVGVWAAARAERHFGCTDPGQVVVDEVAGMLVTLVWIPVGVSGALAGFVLFRIFDVIKPYPARQLEGLHGGLGIMADDVAAGVYANLALHLARRLAPGWIA
jgi:phosphatidylglycerophosphatase A